MCYSKNLSADSIHSQLFNIFVYHMEMFDPNRSDPSRAECNAMQCIPTLVMDLFFDTDRKRKKPSGVGNKLKALSVGLWVWHLRFWWAVKELLSVTFFVCSKWIWGPLHSKRFTHQIQIYDASFWDIENLCQQIQYSKWSGAFLLR